MSVIRPKELPLIMVAPTGARRTKADHPALPMTADEIVETATACFEAGAGAIHAHARDADGGHSLNLDFYSDLVSRLRDNVPHMLVQISTEAVGRYKPEEQIALIRALKPSFVSIALREIFPKGGDEARAADFYRWCEVEGISVQHILYDETDVSRLADFQARRLDVTSRLSAIYVLGRYAVDQESRPGDLEPFLDAAVRFSQSPDWMVCAFGRGETDCLSAALSAGGKVRVGFENSLWHGDGRMASSNAERVAVIRELADRLQEGRGT